MKCESPRMTDREFLESMATSDSLVDHKDNCGVCGHQIVMGEAARQLLTANDVEDGIAKWSDLAKKMWEETKYFKLYQEEVAAGRDPHKAFDERQWEM